jgi:hypothetical protein
MTETSRGRIIYARGFPYGAPLCMIRGGATRDPEVKKTIQAIGFRWDGDRHAWTSYEYGPEFAAHLRRLRDLGCEIQPKADLAEDYILDLDREEQQA